MVYLEWKCMAYVIQSVIVKYWKWIDVFPEKKTADCMKLTKPKQTKQPTPDPKSTMERSLCILFGVVFTVLPIERDRLFIRIVAIW